jgi:hypothetical protein
MMSMQKRECRNVCRIGDSEAGDNHRNAAEMAAIDGRHGNANINARNEMIE